MSRLLLIRLHNKNDGNTVYCLDCGKPYYEFKKVKFRHLNCLMPFSNNYNGCASIVLAGHLDCISMLKLPKRVLFSNSYIPYLMVCILENPTYTDTFIIKLAKTEENTVLQDCILSILCNWPMLGRRLISLCSKKNRQRIINTLVLSQYYTYTPDMLDIFKDTLHFMLKQK